MKSANPLAQVLTVIVGLLLLTAALFVGAFVFIAMLGVAVIGGAILTLRIWWLRRQLRREAGSQTGQSGHRSRQSLTIEGEVVKKEAHRRSDESR